MADCFFDGLHRLPDTIAHGVFDEGPNLLHGVEFGAVGREREQIDSRWYARVASARMKASPIPDDYVLRLRIALRDLLQELATSLQINAATKERLRSVLAIDFQGRVKVAHWYLVW